jgi:hypothetical protein
MKEMEISDVLLFTWKKTFYIKSLILVFAK